MKAQRPIDEVVAIGARREGVKLRTESDLAEKLDGSLRGEAEDVNRASRRPDQASHQVHQGGVARAVGDDETASPGFEREVHLVHAENFAEQPRDILEND